MNGAHKHGRVAFWAPEPEGDGGGKGNTNGVDEMGERLDRLERRVERLTAALERGFDGRVVGDCAHCDRGFLVNTPDGIQCSSCGYFRYF